MATGRHGGYRDNEFRDRGADFGVSKKEIGYSRGGYVRVRTGEREYDRASGRSRDATVSRERVRQKDIREEGLVENSGSRSSSSQSDSGGNGGGPRRCDFYPRNVDREPGELSSDGSDGVVDSEILIKEEAEFHKLENGGAMSHAETKKRKFSPIVWDRDDRKINKVVKTKNVPDANAKSPPPPPTISVSQTVLTDVHHSINSHIKSPPADLSDFLDETSPLQLAEEQQVNGHEEGVIDDRDEDRAPTIISSRWANEANSPADEREISGYDMKLKFSDSAEARRYRKSITPELGEIKREDSVGIGGRFTGSDEYNGSVKRDSFHVDDEDKSDRMEIDDDREVDHGRDSRSQSESGDDLRSLGTPENARPMQRSVNMLQGCRRVDEFERLNKIDEGTYGVVFRAKDKKTGEIVALKKVKMDKEREGFPLTALREINILLSFNHPCIVDVKEVVVGSNLDSIFMVMEYMEHDLKALMETMKQPFSQSEVKCLMLQLLEGIKYLHDNWVLHRDLKTSNLLLNNRGELKICDFGLARQYGSPLKPYTQLVVTLWYRAPELLLGAKEYSTAIDMWSLGCIMAELLSKEPLFNGKSEIEQLDKIFKTLGTPSEAIWPGLSKLPGTKVNFVKHKYNLLRKKFPATSFTGSPVLSDAGFDLLNKLLTYDPQKRITAEEALNHEWFHEVPLPKSKEFMPTFPAHHAQDRRTRRVMKSPDPLEELRRKELQQGEIGSAGLFGQ